MSTKEYAIENKISEFKSRQDILICILITAFVFVLQIIYSYEYSKGNSLIKDGFILPTILRLAIWTLPVIIYLIINRKNPIYYLKLNSNILKGAFWGVIIGMAILVLNIVSMYVLKGRISVNFNLGLNTWIGPVLLVGFSEDVLFRGFILQKTEEYSSFLIGNVVNATLFALIHFPGWILLGEFTMPHVIYSIFYVFAFGLLQGYLFKKTNSLWACIIVHSFNNFTSFAVPL